MVISFASTKVASVDIKRQPNVKQIQQIRNGLNKVFRDTISVSGASGGENSGGGSGGLGQFFSASA